MTLPPNEIDTSDMSDHVIFAIETATGLSIGSILSKQRYTPLMFARAILASHYKREGLTDGRTAKILRRDRTTIIHARQMQEIYLTEPIYKEWHEKFYEILEPQST